MIQVPDISPFLKAGVIGVMAFIILSLLAVIGYLLKSQIAAQKAVREPTAGEKSAEYWEKLFEEIETEGNRNLLLVLRDDHRAVMELLGKIRARVRDSDNVAALTAIKDLRAKYDHDMIEIVKILRKIEMGIER